MENYKGLFNSKGVIEGIAAAADKLRKAKRAVDAAPLTGDVLTLAPHTTTSGTNGRFFHMVQVG